MPQSDEDAIRELEHQFNAAWDAHDPERLAESLADDAQFITVNGAWTTTRNGFRDLMARLHGSTGPFRTSTRRTPDMQVTFLAPDIAILHSRFWIRRSHARRAQPSLARERRHPRRSQDRRPLARGRDAEHRRPPRAAALV
jgi:uncharacterized protein (TIGR02246 family)